jgi:hypothetical protein
MPLFLFLQQILRMRFFQKIKALVVFLLIFATYLLFSNSVVNQHSHLLVNGEIITHAHPFIADKNNHTPFQSHKHNEGILCILDLISNPIVIITGFLAALLVLLPEIFIIPCEYSIKIPLKNYFYYGIYRAPPYANF